MWTLQKLYVHNIRPHNFFFWLDPKMKTENLSHFYPLATFGKQTTNPKPNLTLQNSIHFIHFNPSLFLSVSLSAPSHSSPFPLTPVAHATTQSSPKASFYWFWSWCQQSARMWTEGSAQNSSSCFTSKQHTDTGGYNPRGSDYLTTLNQLLLSQNVLWRFRIVLDKIQSSIEYFTNHHCWLRAVFELLRIRKPNYGLCPRYFLVQALIYNRWPDFRQMLSCSSREGLKHEGTSTSWSGKFVRASPLLHQMFHQI